MRALNWFLIAAGIACTIAFAAMGCSSAPAPSSIDAGPADSGFPSAAAPGTPCLYTGTCADGQCAPSPSSPAGAFFNVGCCVRGNVCRNAGESAVCAFRADYPSDGGTGHCIDCGDGRGLRCGL